MEPSDDQKLADEWAAALGEACVFRYLPTDSRKASLDQPAVFTEYYYCL